MPSQEDRSFGLPSSSLFPADFERDTLHLHQALAEHNYERTAAGLSLQNYFQLSEEDRKHVVDRSNELKFANRPKDCPKVIPIKSRCSQERNFLPESVSWPFPRRAFLSRCRHWHSDHFSCDAVIGPARADLHELTPPATIALERAATILNVLSSEESQGDLLQEARDHVEFLLYVADKEREELWRSVLLLLTSQGEA